MKFSYRKVPRSSDPRDPHIGVPFIPIILHKGEESTMPFFALLDSGADQVVMSSDFAEPLGIMNIKTGVLEQTIGVGSQVVDVYYHEGIEVQVAGNSAKFPTRIGFVETDPGKKKVPPLLGRIFFKHFKSVSFQENNEVIELK